MPMLCDAAGGEVGRPVAPALGAAVRPTLPHARRLLPCPFYSGHALRPTRQHAGGGGQTSGPGLGRCGSAHPPLRLPPSSLPLFLRACPTTYSPRCGCDDSQPPPPHLFAETTTNATTVKIVTAVIVARHRPPGGVVCATTRSRAMHRPPSTSPTSEYPLWLLFCRVLTTSPLRVRTFSSNYGDTRAGGTS